MNLSVRYNNGASVEWDVRLDGPGRDAALAALAKLARPAEARRLGDARDELLLSRSLEFAPGALATWQRDGSLVITIAWGSGPTLVVSDGDPGLVIELARLHLAEGFRAALPSSGGLPTTELRLGPFQARALAATGSYVLHRGQGVLVTSDAGMLRLKGHPDAARLLLVLMRRAGERVTFAELEGKHADPQTALRSLQKHAARVAFPLPMVVEHDSAEFPTPPTLCSSSARYLRDQELEGCGVGKLARRHRVSVGADRVDIVAKDDGTWRGSGTLIPPTDHHRQWRLVVTGPDGARLTELALEFDPCGGPRGLRDVIAQVWVAATRPPAA